jgi:hypothetical protein
MAVAAPNEPPVSGQLGGKPSSELSKEVPPIFTRLYYATTISTVRNLQKPGLWYKGWQDYFYPPPFRPDLVKKYEGRPLLPVR